MQVTHVDFRTKAIQSDPLDYAIPFKTGVVTWTKQSMGIKPKRVSKPRSKAKANGVSQ